MFKKLIAKALTALLIFVVIPSVVSAAEVETDFILGTEITVFNSADDVFEPENGELLIVDLLLDVPNFALQLADVSGYMIVTKDGNTVVTLDSWSNSDITSLAIPIWDGAAIDNTPEAEAICGGLGDFCPTGSYEVEVYIEHDTGTDLLLTDSDSSSFSIGAGGGSISIETFTVTNDDGGAFDPASGGENETLTIEYSLSEEPENAWLNIITPLGDTIKTYSADEQSDTFNWDGVHLSELIIPGDYEAELVIEVLGGNTIYETIEFTVDYENSHVADINDLEIFPDNFDPDDDDAVIEFENSEDSDIWVEIYESNDNKVREFSSYDGDEYSSDTLHSLSWNGRDDDNDQVDSGNYTVHVTTRNEYGVDFETETVQVNNNGSSSSSSSNSHIDGIQLKPSSNFEPAEDDPLEIEWDVEKDLDELSIFAVRGSEEIELFAEDDVEEENNREIEWDGTNDDGDYVDPGTWRIEFRSELNGVDFEATENISIRYDEPNISDAFLSKAKFDNDLDEFTYIVFKVGSDAEVLIEVIENDDVDDEIVEDMEVEKNKWYAVEWDGDSYDHEDELEIKITAKNPAHEEVIDTEKLSVNLHPDTLSTRTNVTNDFVDPVAAERGEDIAIYYELNDEAEVSITIYKGESSSGSTVIELLDEYEHDEGQYGLIWDGKDDDGDTLSSGIYSYKIVSNDGGKTDTEKGAFVIGTVGTVDGSSGSSSSSSSSSSQGSVAPNVIIDGVSFFDGFGNSGYYSDGCAGFNDVDPNSEHCTAISWAESANIFEGYSDGSFQPDAAISRVELLKVILESTGSSIPSVGYGNLGFSDVVADAWYVKYISYGRSLNVVSGDNGNNTFRPDDDVNRVEALKMMFETAKVLNGYQISNCSYSYVDTASDEWYHAYVCASKSLDLFELYGYQNFVASASATRAEIASALYKLAQAGIL